MVFVESKGKLQREVTTSYPGSQAGPGEPCPPQRAKSVLTTRGFLGHHANRKALDRAQVFTGAALGRKAFTFVGTTRSHGRNLTALWLHSAHHLPGTSYGPNCAPPAPNSLPWNVAAFGNRTFKGVIKLK